VLTVEDVTACLVTRGDQPEQMERIIATLPYGQIIVWDNSVYEDFKTAGRYAAMLEAPTRYVYFQDDDTLFTHHAELVAEHEPGCIVATYGHGDNDGGYGDLPLVCGGAIADKFAVISAMRNYNPAPLDKWSDEDLYYADFAIGVLCPFWHVPLPFEINLAIAQHPSRLCNQPWAADAKARVTERARKIRDGALSVA
jgi:hypothetical protein